MKNCVSVLFVILFFASNLKAQFDRSSDNWRKMADVEYEKATDEYGEIYVPKFGGEVRMMEGQRISLEGFIVPFEGMFKPNQIILSSLPIASCFFCGGSGPETVAEAHLVENISYTAKPVTIRGTLTLNDRDYDQLMYILKDAELIHD
ncbi:MAG: hypothetical protein AAF789_13500 [Bacteroidota bacterium]